MNWALWFLFSFLIKKILMRCLKVILHLQLLQNIGYIPSVVRCVSFMCLGNATYSGKS